MLQKFLSEKTNIKMLLNKLKTRLFPSHIDLMARRWDLDGGGERFRFDYELDEKSVVLDLGGYDGQWASDMYGRYGFTVYVFEHVQEYAEKIISRFEKNLKIEVIPYALGGGDHKLEIAVSGTSISVFAKGGHSQEIQIVDVSKWIEGSGLTAIDLMKVNIEGANMSLWIA